ncbi:hypothetical protein L3V35_08240 [Vibrio sp. L5-1]|uniref:hypothetical protein n=1 Tax=Vibrio sp. L5-1 TaxID=2912254 RepID=UPI001F26ED13|nr:hypothetical protein [Vibrio sp. L5-1]MCF7495036.1 hypothetical protein [Vibrio sp. L5-1]
MNIQQAKQQVLIGTQVKYFPLIKDKAHFHIGEVRSEPWEVCGELVVNVSGKAGGLSVEHLGVITDED